MSYSVYLTIDTGGEEPATVAEVGGITWNVMPMYYRALGGEGFRQLRGMTAEDALPLLDAGIRTMTANPEEYRALNPPNGWGSYGSALAFLDSLYETCKENPKATIKIL